MPTRPLTKRQVREALEAWFAGLEVVADRRGMRIVVTAEDIRNGIPGNPCKCALALAWRRSCGTPLVLVLGLYAYVQLVDEDGITRVHMFALSERMKKAIKQFDRVHEMPTLAFDFMPPHEFEEAKREAKKAAAEKQNVRDTKKPKRKSVPEDLRTRDQPVAVNSARNNVFLRGPGAVQEWVTQNPTQVTNA